MNLPDLDFSGWHKDMIQQQTIKFTGAQSPEERRSAAEMIAKLREWEKRAEKAA